MKPRTMQLPLALLVLALLGAGCGQAVGAQSQSPNSEDGQAGGVQASGSGVAASPDDAIGANPLTGDTCGTTRQIDYPDDPAIEGQTVSEALARAAEGAGTELTRLRADPRTAEPSSLLSAELAAAVVRSEVYAILTAIAAVTPPEGESSITLPALDGVVSKGSVTLEDLGSGWAVTREELVLPGQVCTALEARVPPPPQEQGPEMARETPTD